MHSKLAKSTWICATVRWHEGSRISLPAATRVRIPSRSQLGFLRMPEGFLASARHVVVAEGSWTQMDAKQYAAVPLRGACSRR
jgi:hypothetical protein